MFCLFQFLDCLISGASSGLGLETTRALALRGVHVIMAVRNTDAGRNVKEEILKEIPMAKIDVMELDLSSMASVRKFASEYNSSGRPLHILINNAGVMATPFMLSKDNIEMQFATNHLGHFLLTNLLLETMKKTTREGNKEGRIVNLSSEAHRFAYTEGIRFDKIHDESGLTVKIQDLYSVEQDANRGPVAGGMIRIHCLKASIGSWIMWVRSYYL
ncbi:short-chain dehydrogenase TIC 32 [Pyrus ussuriensis x Pyrus communis]|uniref:Short-chain dehydrogenase TIC 32 n=1 Tax=Pyrus ussuriensis x Pyrus communis TaxID=2448454 RepID=A0A5N5HGV8_9ROSA|nr:short-chain dehydrogenase TIC 32 [Pyrus ussuriensis x Pyrus communis]